MGPRVACVSACQCPAKKCMRKAGEKKEIRRREKKGRTVRLVDDDDLVREVDAERFARGLLQEEVVGQEDELRYASSTVNNNRASPSPREAREEGDG